MGRVYKGQSSLRITLKTFMELEGTQKTLIKYRKPDDAIGEFAAAVSDTVNGVLYHDCALGEINASGWWVFWAFIVFSDGRTAIGEASKVFIWNEGAG